jgi:uncharacterized repeat protein (TIGR02543 family)
MLEPRRARSVHARIGADGGRRLRRSIVALLVLGLALAGSVFAAPAPAVAASSGGVTKLTTTATEKANLVMSDEIAAWQESNHIFIYTPAGGVVDLSGAIGGSNQLDQSPQVSGDRVVWWTQAGGRSDIYTWAISDPVIQRVSTDSLLYSQEPQISGDRIVFQAWQGAGYQVFTWTPEGGVEQVSTNSNTNWLRAKVSGDRIAYLIRDAEQHWSLYSWVAGGGAPVRIASDVVWDDLNLTDMADGRVVGLGLAAGSGSFEVITWAAGDTTLTRVGAFTAQDHEPRISGGRIVWENAAGGVDTWSVTDPTVSLATDAGATGVSPGISGNHVAWATSLGRQGDPNNPMYLDTQIIGHGPVLWTPGATTLTNIPYEGQLASQVLVSPSRVAFLGWDGDPFNGGVQQVYTYETGHPITATAGAHGSITPAGTSWVLPDNTATYMVMPDAGYHVDGVTVDGDPVSLTDGKYVFSGVSGDHTIAVTFAIDTFTVTTTAGPHGSITPAGPIVMDWHTSQRFDFTPDEGYHVENVISDGYSYGSSPWLSYGQTESDHDLSVTFAISSYALKYVAGSGGTISGFDSQTVEFGSAGTLVTATPASGYHFTGWSDGVTTAARTDSNVIADHAVTATFAINTYTLTYAAGTGGSIVGSSPQVVNSGSDGTLVTATPASGYHFVSWSDLVLTAARTDSNVIADHAVTAQFTINTETVTFDGNTGSPSSITATAAYNTGVGTNMPAAPTKTGYTFAGWFTASSGGTQFTGSTLVTANITVYAQFAPSAICRDDTATAFSRPLWVTPLLNDDEGVGVLTSFGQPSHGTVTRPDGAPAGSLLYTPDNGYLGKDSFTYETASGQGATVELTVVPNISAPRNVEAAKATTRSIAVTWDAPESFGSGFVSYQVKWRSHGTETWNLLDPTTDPSARSLTITDLVPGVTYDIAVTVRDGGEYTATANAAPLLLIGDVPVPVAPPAAGTVDGTTTVSITGVSSDASLTVDPDAADEIPGVGGVSIDGLRVTIVPDPGFSGLIDLPVTVHQDGTETIVHVLLTVSPADPYSVTFGPASSHSTRMQWAGSAGATGYRICVGATVVGTTGPDASSFAYGKLLGPNAGVTVQALGDAGTASAQVRAAYKSVAAVRIGTVTFKANSSKLTSTDKSSLRKLVALVKAQGFKTLTINGVTGKGSHGSAAFRKRLATARAKAVRTYLLGRFKVAHYSVKITIVTSSGKGMASKYRIAEIAIH